MSKTIAFDRGEVLQKAMVVFWDSGFAATSMRDLLDATGLSASSLYAEFGSKRALFDVALQDYDEGLSAMLDPLQRGEPGLEGILDFFDNWRERLAQGRMSFDAGCFMVNSTIELASHDDRVRALAQQYRERLRSLLAAAIQRAADRGQLYPGNTDERATGLTAAVIGVFAASRAFDNAPQYEYWIAGARGLAASWALHPTDQADKGATG